MPREEWSKESIKLAFEGFLATNGRLPTAPEVDNSPDLPSARQIQRKFGGLRVLRAELGYDNVDFGSGDSRSQMAATHNTRSINAERLLEQELIGIFGELYVHSEKFYGSGKNRVDFFVYTMRENFGVDVFTTETTRDLQKNINIKIDKYRDFPENIDLYFAVASVNLTDEDISTATANMSKLASISKLKIVSISDLVEQATQYTPLVSPSFVSLNKSS